MIVGGDNNTFYSVGATETGNSGGRIRAVTASIHPMPIGRGLWGVTVNNASTGPITDLEVDVYAVDDAGRRVEGKCHPAKGKLSPRDLFREALTGPLTGTLDAIGDRARAMFPSGVLGVPSNLGAYGGMFTDHLAFQPQTSQILQVIQRNMVDSYPEVIARDQSAGVLFSVDDGLEVRVDLLFADDMGNLWRRRHGSQPEPVLEGE